MMLLVKGKTIITLKVEDELTVGKLLTCANLGFFKYLFKK